MSDEKQRVHLLWYHHRHGQDVWVFSTQERAFAGMAKLAEQWFGEWEQYDNDSERVSTMRAILDNHARYYEIEDAWSAYTDEGESFRIEYVTVDAEPG